MKVPFAKPSFSNEDLDEILIGVRTVLQSGWLTSGKNVEALERDFAEITGTRHAVTVNSCTAALHSILMAIGVERGDEVIVPSNTFVATANAALYVGARPVFADSDPETFNVSPEDVENKISRKTKAIIAVHLGGNPCDMKALKEIAQDNKIMLLEDCAHAHGSRFQGENCGSIGLAGAFSLYATKIMTSCEGGLVTTDEQWIADRVKKIRNQGRGGYGPQEITELGHNYRMSDVHAVIALSQMRHLTQFVNERQQIAREYSAFLSAMKWVRPQLVKNEDSCSYYAYLLRLSQNAPIGRDQLVKNLAGVGVGTSVLYHPAHSQPFYIRTLRKDAECPVADELGKNTLALPMFNGMTKSQLEYVKEKWNESFSIPREQYASAA